MTHSNYSTVPPIALRQLTTHQGFDEGLLRKGWMLPQVPSWQGITKVWLAICFHVAQLFVKY